MKKNGTSATEKRLIDANELVSILEEYATGIYYEDIFSMSVLKRIIGERKTVDAVEVVRCKDCKAFHNGKCDRLLGLPNPYPDSFCSYGERRTDNA